jgi:hypothetical protein
MEDHCDSCGFDGRPLTLNAVAAHLGQLPDPLRRCVAEASDKRIRSRQSANWSALEYVGHLKDVMAFHRWLVERAMAEDRPHIDAVDPDTAVEDAEYNQANLEEVLDQLERRVHRLCHLLRDLGPGVGQRQLVLGDDLQIDVHLIARNALHELHHHTLDVEHLLGNASSRGS